MRTLTVLEQMVVDSVDNLLSQAESRLKNNPNIKYALDEKTYEVLDAFMHLLDGAEYRLDSNMFGYSEFKKRSDAISDEEDKRMANA